jgi:hypothetical protein
MLRALNPCTSPSKLQTIHSGNNPRSTLIAETGAVVLLFLIFIPLCAIHQRCLIPAPIIHEGYKRRDRRTLVLHGSSTAHRLLHEWVLSLQSFTFYFSASSCPPVLPTIRANTPRCDVNGGSFRPRNVGSGLRPSMYSSPSCNAVRDVDLRLLVPRRSPP